MSWRWDLNSVIRWFYDCRQITYLLWTLKSRQSHSTCRTNQTTCVTRLAYMWCSCSLFSLQDSGMGLGLIFLKAEQSGWRGWRWAFSCLWPTPLGLIFHLCRTTGIILSCPWTRWQDSVECWCFAYGHTRGGPGPQFSCLQPQMKRGTFQLLLSVFRVAEMPVR